MRVISFIGPNSTWAFTADDTGGNLPTDKGPWKKYKRYNIHRGQQVKIAVDVDWVIDAITAGGYYLTTAPSASRKSGIPKVTGEQKRAPDAFALAGIIDKITIVRIELTREALRNAVPALGNNSGQKRAILH